MILLSLCDNPDVLKVIKIVKIIINTGVIGLFSHFVV